MRLAVVLGLVVTLALPSLGRAQGAGGNPDALAAAGALAAIQEATACDPASALCAAGRRSLLGSITYLVLQGRDCGQPAGLAKCTGASAQFVAAHLSGGAAMTSPAPLLPDIGDPQFQPRFQTALAQVKSRCAYGKVFCADAKLAVLVQANNLLGAQSCNAAPDRGACLTQQAGRIKTLHDAAATYLAELFRTDGWPGADVYGHAADADVWRLLQAMSGRSDLLHIALSLAQAADARGATDAANLPALVDETALADGKAQSFGTQGSCQGQVWTAAPIDDPAGLASRRAEYKQEPMADYVKRMSKTCG